MVRHVRRYLSQVAIFLATVTSLIISPTSTLDKTSSSSSSSSPRLSRPIVVFNILILVFGLLNLIWLFTCKHIESSRVILCCDAVLFASLACAGILFLCGTFQETPGNIASDACFVALYWGFCLCLLWLDIWQSVVFSKLLPSPQILHQQAMRNLHLIGNSYDNLTLNDDIITNNNNNSNNNVHGFPPPPTTEDVRLHLEGTVDDELQQQQQQHQQEPHESIRELEMANLTALGIPVPTVSPPTTPSQSSKSRKHGNSIVNNSNHSYNHSQSQSNSNSNSKNRHHNHPHSHPHRLGGEIGDVVEEAILFHDSCLYDGFRVHINRLNGADPRIPTNLTWNHFTDIHHRVTSSSCDIYAALWDSLPVILKIIKEDRLSSSVSLGDFDIEASVLSRVKEKIWVIRRRSWLCLKTLE